MADCDMCRTKEFKDGWMGPKQMLDLNSKLMWICENCRTGKEIVHIDYPRKPIAAYMPYAGLAAFTIIICTLLLSLIR